MPAAGIPGIDNRPQAVQPNYLSPGQSMGSSAGSGEVRVSLTGEALEVLAPSPKVINSPSSRSSGAGSSARPGPTAPAARRGASRVRSNYHDDDENASRGNKQGTVYLVILVLAAACFGGYWWYNNRTNPKDQTLKVFTAIKAQDWKTIYANVELSDTLKKKYPDADTYTKDIQTQISQNPQAKMMLDTVLGGMSDIAAGEPTMKEGGKADVPTSCKMSILGQSATFKGVAHMIKIGGVWKLDYSTASDPATAQRLGQELIGQPEGGMPGSGRR